jgi:hypothetical protein
MVKPRKLAGAVHGEAILMGLTTACAEQPANPGLLPEFVGFLKVNSFPLDLSCSQPNWLRTLTGSLVLERSVVGPAISLLKSWQCHNLISSFQGQQG